MKTSYQAICKYFYSADNVFQLLTLKNNLVSMALRCMDDYPYVSPDTSVVKQFAIQQ